MRRRQLLTTALVSIPVLTVSGCGRDSDDSAGDVTASDISSGPATGTITVWAMGTEGEKLPDLVKEFEAANPDASVEVTAIPWDSAHDKFTTAIAAGTTPDVAMVGTTWMSEFAGQGALDPTPPSFDSSVFFSGAQATTEVNGVSYGVPWYVETRLIYYRTDLAADAGFSTPPTDWDGLSAMARAMQSSQGATWGIGLQPGATGSWQTILPFGWSNGASITKDDDTAYNFDTTELAEAVEYYQSFFTDGIADTSGTSTSTTEADFVGGQVPMFMSGPWMMASLETLGGEAFGDQYDVMLVPARQSSTSFVGGSDLVVFKNTENRDSAWKLIQFLSEPETQVSWYQMSTDLPSVTSAWSDQALAGNTKLATFGEQLETAVAPPTFATWEQVIAEFDSEMEKVTKSGADAAQALEAVQKQADTIGTGQ